LKKNYFSSHKLPKQQSTSFWSQGILGVKVKEDSGYVQEITLLGGTFKSMEKKSLREHQNGYLQTKCYSMQKSTNIILTMVVM
jgi:hypothetical protein